MIDIENELFSMIKNQLEKSYKGIAVYSEEIRTPIAFPCVSIVEEDNYTFMKTQDSGSNENHANVMYEVNVYSNKMTGKKTEAKKILSKIDDIMILLGFTRMNKFPVIMDDATIYRVVARYRGVVSQNHTIYRG